MNKGKELARHVLYIARQCLGFLNESVWLTKLHCTEEEFFKHRRAVGQVMGALLDEIMWPLYREHPELDPDPRPTKGNPEGSSCQASPPAEGASPPEEPGEPGPDDRKS